MRIDHDLAFLLQFENVAWYEDGKVKILDRRVYPMKTEYVICNTHLEVVKAIQDMVTQSGGPYLAASMGMVLAAYEYRNLNKEDFMISMRTASDTIANARPTTQTRMRRIVDDLINDLVNKDWDSNEEALEILREGAIAEVSGRYERIEKIGIQLADLIPQGGTVMTQCFAETIVGMMCRRLREIGNDEVDFITPETRPYLQGARLTSSVISDMGFEVHVITDNMPGYILKEKKVDLFTSASDMITQDGYVVNKIGTFQIAALCHIHQIPYFVTGAPSVTHKTIDTVKIEERDHDEVLSHLGTRVTKENVKAYYPAFDITPPNYCSGVITEKGIYSPYDLKSYFKD